MLNSAEHDIVPAHNVKILTFVNRINSVVGSAEPEKCWISLYFYTYKHLKLYAQLSWAWNFLITLGPDHNMPAKQTDQDVLLSQKLQVK